MNSAVGNRPGAAVGLAPLLALLIAFAALVAGCTPQPRMLPPRERLTIDRAKVEYPAGFNLERFIVNLTGPTAFAFDADGNLIVAEGGVGGKDVRILGFRQDGTRFDVYPLRHNIPLFAPVKFEIYGPVGGMLVHDGWVYVSHRDENDLGRITALDYKGNHRTIVAGLPAQGEHGVTDLAYEPVSKRLFFGVGSATNSGVVGMDDFAIGWPKDHPLVHDIPYKRLVLWGRRFDTPNPNASPLFGIGDIAVSAAFQPFGVSNKTTIPGVIDGPQNTPPKFNAGIFSVPIAGGEIKAEAHGIRYPWGLAFRDYSLYFTNRGMEMRGSRPVKDDPDALVLLQPGAGQQIGWYGWPDFSTDFRPVTDRELQPPERMILRYGYPDVSFLINHRDSGLLAPGAETFLAKAFPSQSGASGLVFVPTSGPLAAGPFQEYAGNAIVALFGDRAPFSTSGEKILGPIGFKVVRVDMERRTLDNFIRNTGGSPASRVGGDQDLLERPIQVRFGPDGSLYVLDFGRMQMKDGREDVTSGTGKIYRLVPAKPPTTQPGR